MGTSVSHDLETSTFAKNPGSRSSFRDSTTTRNRVYGRRASTEKGAQFVFTTETRDHWCGGLQPCPFVLSRSLRPSYLQIIFGLRWTLCDPGSNLPTFAPASRSTITRLKAKLNWKPGGLAIMFPGPHLL